MKNTSYKEKLKEYQESKRKFIVLTSIIIVIIGFISIYTNTSQKLEITKQLEDEKYSSIKQLFDFKLKETKRIYTSKLIAIIKHEKRIIDAFKEKDRETLYKEAKPLFEKLKIENPYFEIMCFGLPDKTAFLRVHKKEFYGDDISSIKNVDYNSANKTGYKDFVFSKIGLYYRVSEPVFYENEFIGFISFGIKLRHFTNLLKDLLGAPTAVVAIDKQTKEHKLFSFNSKIFNKLPRSLSSLKHNTTLKIGNKKYIIRKNIEKGSVYLLTLQEVSKLHRQLSEQIFQVILFNFLIVIISIVSLHYATDFFLIKLLEEQHKNQDKDKLILQQSKLAIMGDMLSMIAHQWRQPLNNIALIIQDLEDESEFREVSKKEIKEYVDKAMEKIIGLSNTINNFSNFFQPAKKLEFVEVHSIIEKSIALLSEKIETSKIEMVFEKGKDFGFSTYQNELIQVITNLLTNSIDAVNEKSLEEKKIFINIDTTYNVRITIDDTGGGVDKKTLEKLFEPYYSTKNNIGSGLGLYMAKILIEEHLQGDLQANNSETGLIYTITLQKDLKLEE